MYFNRRCNPSLFFSQRCVVGAFFLFPLIFLPARTKTDHRPFHYSTAYRRLPTLRQLTNGLLSLLLLARFIITAAKRKLNLRKKREKRKTVKRRAKLCENISISVQIARLLRFEDYRLRRKVIPFCKSSSIFLLLL